MYDIQTILLLSSIMYQGTNVKELGSKDFKLHRKKNIIHHRSADNKHEGIIKFYASWCGHCKNFKNPMLNLVKKGIPMKALDCERYGTLSEKLGVQGFPTLGFVNKHGQIFRYDGSREEDAIIKAYREFQSKGHQQK